MKLEEHTVIIVVLVINHLNAELNPICHLLALVGTHHILHVSRVRVKIEIPCVSKFKMLTLARTTQVRIGAGEGL